MGTLRIPHRRRIPVQSAGCQLAGHDYPLKAVDRHGTGVEQCPLCSARIDAIPLAGGRVRIPAHSRLSSVTVRTVRS